MRKLKAFLIAFVVYGTCHGQILPAGALDMSFNTGTGLEASVVLTQGIRVKALNDGRVLIGGDFGTYNDTTTNGFICLNENGSINQTFYNNYNCNGIIRDIVLQDDGKILLASANACNGVPTGRLVRLHPDGTLDNSLNLGLGFGGGNLLVRAVAVQGDKLIVGGDFASYQGSMARYLSRINSDGSPDPTFSHPYNGGNYAFTNGGIQQIRVQPDGKIIAVGPIGDIDGTWHTIQRLNPDGTLDTPFNTNINALNGGVRYIDLLDNGQILLMGAFTQYGSTPAPRMCRLNADGTLDPTFNSGITSLNENPALPSHLARFAVQDDGKIVVVGWFNTIAGQNYGSIVRLNPDGSIDSTWDTGTGLNYPATDVDIAYDGKVYIVGRFWECNNNPTGGAIRLNAEPLDVTSARDAEVIQIRVYPNPTSDQLNIQASFPISSATIFDISGRMVMKESVFNQKELLLHMASLQNGMYRVLIDGSGESRSVSILKVD